MSSTAVRVALRVRPLTQKEQLSNCTECISFIPQQPQIIIGKDHSFTYDYVFDTQTPQHFLYQSSVTPLLEKFMEGYNATILAYGQTGSGKTYSMGTALDIDTTNSENQGIVPRFIRDLFRGLERKQHEMKGDFEYQVYVSFLELYNEDLVDLLNMEQISHNRKRTNSGTSVCEIAIREDVQGNIYWTGVREEPCSNPDDLLGFLAKGSLCRTTGSTDMNAVSSRSHAIFSIILKQQLPETDQAQPSSDSRRTLVSKFHFVDLAGSERLKRTNAQGDRAREGIAINSGLLALGNVISALGDESRRSMHVPYRDSKLTRLLQDSLGGNSQTLMLACVSPSDSNFMETLSTLKYANRARNIKNRVAINQEFAGSSVEVNQLRAQVARLKMELNAMRACGPTMIMNDSNEQILSLQQENKRLKTRIQQTTDELCEVATERDALLMEREAGQDWPKLTELLMKEDDGENRANDTTRSFPMIAQYQRTIQELRQELADTKQRLEFSETARQPMMQALAIASNLTPSASHCGLFSTRPPVISSSSQRSTHSQRRRATATGRRRRVNAGSKHSKVFRTTRRSKVPSVSASRRRQLDFDDQRFNGSSSKTQPIGVKNSPVRPKQVSNANDDHDDIESWLKRTMGSINASLSHDIQSEVRFSIQKAKAEIDKGLKVLEDVKQSKDIDVNDQQQESGDEEELLIKMKTEESLMMLSEMMEGLEDDNKVPTEKYPQVPRRNSNTNSEDAEVPEFTKEEDPQFFRLIQQIQDDIHVKEELVSQLERSEAEYDEMRVRFKQKLYSLREEILTAQYERDQAMRRSSYAQSKDTAFAQREKQQLSERCYAYEQEIKRLMSQLSNLRRKYSQTTAAIQSSRNQNETMLRTLRVNVEALKVEKRRMIKRMRSEAERVKEQLTAHEREIQQLRRRQAQDAETKSRLENEKQQQHVLLQKRTKDLALTTDRLKQLVQIVNNVIYEGAPVDEKLLSKYAMLADIPANPRQAHKRKSKKNKNTVDVRAAKKKSLLDRALFQFIQGKQAILEMRQLIYKRDELASQRAEILAERDHLLAGQDLAVEPLDQAVQQFMDERLETIVAEISYLNTRIHALQNDAAHEMMQDDEQVVLQDLSSAARASKHVKFADQMAEDIEDNSTAKEDNGWLDMDALEIRYSLPPNADPDASHDMVARLLKSFTADESERVMEALIDDIVALRMGEYNRQVTMQQLEKTAQDLRRALIIMKKTAINTTIANEKKIRKLRRSSRRLSTTGSMSSKLSSLSDEIADDDSAIDLDIEDKYQRGCTIFDKIYDDGIRGVIKTPTWDDEDKDQNAGNMQAQADADESTTIVSSSYVPAKPIRPQSVAANVMDRAASSGTGAASGTGPVKPSISPIVRRRDSMSSPEQFLQEMLQSGMRVAKDILPPPPSPVMKPASVTGRSQGDRDSSTAGSVRSGCLRRSSVQSDTMSWSTSGSSEHSMVGLYTGNKASGATPSVALATTPVSAVRRRAQSMQQPLQHLPATNSSKRRLSLRELSLGAGIGANGIIQPSPLQQNYVPSAAEQYDSPRTNNSMALIPVFNKDPISTVSVRHNSAYGVSMKVNRPSTAMAFHQSSVASQQRVANPSCDMTRRSSTPSPANVFHRLSSVHTQASQAKKRANSIHRFSSGSVDELRRRWDLEHPRNDAPVA
ncbi:Kinesin-like protein kif21b [Apophysomyces ossiformis]|uniref:Kinesin-like protein kif21b n=1 Tax=Apophysomyces ossiformis TaxID=679940 RepID=A0A8H7BS10_9FUNG|nr:Kinesin-like protein kif21b [Apophysomyces ossiformis]